MSQLTVAQIRTPEVADLDPEWRYTFSELWDRKPLRLDYPEIKPQADFRFEATIVFFIRPDGKVESASWKNPPTIKHAWATSSLRTIRKWRFSPKDTRYNDRVEVKIIFKGTKNSPIPNTSTINRISTVNGRKFTRLVEPIYDVRQQDSILVEFLISPSGEVEKIVEVRSLQSTPSRRPKRYLQHRAAQAVKSWRFKPLPSGYPNVEHASAVFYFLR